MLDVNIFKLMNHCLQENLNEAIEYGIKNLEKCFDGISNPDVEKITHICCGYPDKLDAIDYPKAPLNSYHQIAELLDNSIIDSISIEDAHRYNNLSLLDKFKKSKIILVLLKLQVVKKKQSLTKYKKE